MHPEQCEDHQAFERFLDERGDVARIRGELQIERLDEPAIQEVTHPGDEAARRDRSQYPADADQAIAVQVDEACEETDDGQQSEDGLKQRKIDHP